MRYLAALFFLTACVTHAPSPVDAAFTERLAPPALTVRFADPDGLPGAYDDALALAVPGGGPRAGYAAQVIEREVAAGIAPRLSAYAGDASASLDVEIVDVILPDATRFTPLSGQKSFAVALRLTAPDGAVLAETTRPIVVLSDMQKRGGRLSGSAWSRLGDTDRLRAEAILSLAEATARIVGEAMTGGRTQTGLSGGLSAYPERLPR